MIISIYGILNKVNFEKAFDAYCDGHRVIIQKEGMDLEDPWNEPKLDKILKPKENGKYMLDLKMFKVLMPIVMSIKIQWKKILKKRLSCILEINLFNYLFRNLKKISLK